MLILVYLRLCYPQRVLVADAGPTKELTFWGQLVKNSFMPYQYARMSDDNIINTREYIRVLVDGKCMEPRGIMDKTHVLVQRIEKDIPFQQQIKIGDVLLIRLHDKWVYKLRILQNYDDVNELITYRYQNGEKHQSSRNHNHKDVIGVVKYLIN